MRPAPRNGRGRVSSPQPAKAKAPSRHLREDSGPSKKIRQRPTLPRGFPRSTIGSGGLNFRVRDGNGWDPSDIATGNCVTVHTKGRVSIPARSAFFRAGTTLVECARGLDLGLESSRPTRLAGRAHERLR